MTRATMTKVTAALWTESSVAMKLSKQSTIESAANVNRFQLLFVLNNKGTELLLLLQNCRCLFIAPRATAACM